MSKYFLKYNRCYYEMSKEIFGGSNNKWSRQKGFQRHAANIIAFIYSFFRLSFLFYVMSNNFNVPFLNDYRRYDLPLNYLYRFSNIFDESVIVVLTLFAVFYFSCEWLTSRLNLQHRTWQFWYQFVVQSQDNYYACKCSNEKLEEILTILTNKYQTKLSELCFIESLPLFFIIKKHIFRNCAKMEAFFSMLDIDQETFSKRRPSLAKLPNLSFNNRRRAVITMIISDLMFFYFQIIISKF